MIALVVAIGMIGYGFYLAKIQDTVDTSMDKPKSANEVRERLFFCFGANDILYANKMTTDCDVYPYGFKILQLSYGPCSEQTLKEFNLANKKEKYIFNAIIRPVTGTDNCIGRIEVYIDGSS